MTTTTRLRAIEKAALGLGLGDVKTIVVWDDEPTVSVDGEEIPVDVARKKYPASKHTWITIEYSDEAIP